MICPHCNVSPEASAALSGRLHNTVSDAKGKSAVRAAPIPRPEKTLPPEISSRLDTDRLLEAYNARPRYQRTDYITWIDRAVRADTRERRIVQMIEELRGGDAYMGMAYNAKSPN